MEINSVDSLESRENKTVQKQNVYLQDSGSLPFQPRILLSEIIPHMLIGLRHLDPNIFTLYLFLDLDDFVRVNRA